MSGCRSSTPDIGEMRGRQRRLDRAAQQIMQVERLIPRIAALAGMQEQESMRGIQRRPERREGGVRENDLVILRARRHGKARPAGLRPRRDDLRGKRRLRHRQVIERRQTLGKPGRQRIEAIIDVEHPRPHRRRLEREAIERRRDRNPGALHAMLVHPGDQSLGPIDRFGGERVAVDRHRAVGVVPADAGDAVPMPVLQDRRQMGMDIERDALPVAFMGRDSRGGRARRRGEHGIALHELEPRLLDLVGGAEHLAVKPQPVAVGDLGDLLGVEADRASGRPAAGRDGATSW